MFSRLASVIYNAVEVLAPPLPLQEEFISHWDATANFYRDKHSCGKTPIEMTKIPYHLDQMISLIKQECNEYETDSPGPCIEYMLQHKVLDTMCVLARADTPPGMKRHVLKFVSCLLDQTHYSLLPHINVYGAVQKLIKLCGESVATPSEKEEISFLHILCQKLNQHPNWLSCFIIEANLPTSKRKSSNYSPEKNKTNFPIIKSLLTLLQSPDSEVVDMVCDCLTVAVTLPNEKVIDAIVSSEFCDSLISHMGVLYKAIPKLLKPIDIERAFTKSDPESTNIRMSPSHRKLLCFFKWLDLINKISEVAQPLISQALAKSFRNDFLENILYLDLTNEDEGISIFGTSMVSGCFANISAIVLQEALGCFLVGDTAEPEIPGFVQHILKTLLIERCRNIQQSPMLGMTTLQLFEDIIRKPTAVILESLFLCNLRGRTYYDNSAADEFLGLSDEECEAFASHYLNQEFEESAEMHRSQGNVFAPSHIDKILNCFFMLLPNEIKSCRTQDESGYDVYVKDAHRQFQECLYSCERCDWPIEPLTSEISNSDEESCSDSNPEADHATRPFFYEGTFLAMIFDNLENMLNQPYEVNLQITSLVSKIALIPHPNLHEYFLNPFLALRPFTRSLFSVLLKVVEDIQVTVQHVNDLEDNLQLVRRSLLTEESQSEDCLFEEARTLEALIVVEEFCKELAAITFVKYHAAS